MESSEEKQEEQPETSFTSLRSHGALAAVLLVAGLVINLYHRHGLDTGLMSNGQWVGDQWHPDQCVLHQFKKSDLVECLTLRNHITFIGEESLGQYAWIFVDSIPHEDKTPLKSSWVFYEDPSTHAVVEYIPYLLLDKKIPNEYFRLSERLQKTSPVIIHRPWQFQSGDQTHKVVASCKSNLEALLMAQKTFVSAVLPQPSSGPVTVLQMSPIVTNAKKSDGDLSDCLQVAQDIYASCNLSSIMFLKSVPLPEPISERAHDSYQEEYVPGDMSIILNTFCGTSWSATCSVSEDWTYYNYIVIPLLLVFLSVYMGIWLIFLSGATFVLTPHLEAMSFDFKKFFSIFNSIGILVVTMTYFLVCDRLDYFSRANKIQSPTVFLFLIAAIIVCGALTRTSIEKPEFMSREQVGEWKGWMILTLMACQYTAMDETTTFRLVSQQLVGSFLFLTAYTHFIHFWTKGDFSWKKTGRVLAELNFFALCACFTLKNPYGTYYLVALLSGTFLFLYVLVIFPAALYKDSLEGSSDQDEDCSPPCAVGVVLVIASVILSVLPFLESVVRYFLSHYPLKFFFQSPSGMFELYYWAYYQRYMVLWGLLVGYIVVTVRANKVSFMMSHCIKIAAGALSAVVLLTYLCFISFCEDKTTCSGIQAYISVFPVLAYLFLRNVTGALQGSYSELLNSVGSSVLWLFVSGQHILMALNGRGRLVFFPRQYSLNLLAVAVVFLFIYRIVQQSSKVLHNWVFGAPAVTFTV